MAKETSNTESTIKESFVTGKVLSTEKASLNQELLNATGIVSKQQLVEIEIQEGPLKGQKVVVANEITDNPAFNIDAKPGGEVILSVVQQNNSKTEINIADYHRMPTLTGLLIIFLIVYFIFGGKQGIKSLIGLIICIALIALVLLPLSLKGFNPLITASIISLLATTITITSVSGFSKKSLSAIIGTIGGVLVAGIASHLVIISGPLTGLSSEEAQILRGSVLNQPAYFYTGLLAAGMLIGALGVIIDVGISVASCIFEVSETNKNLNKMQLYKAGMNVGRDIMGAMTNTLVLAYTGSALPLLLLLANMPSIKFLNLDLVATEIAAALTGSLGLVLTIPLTAIVASTLMSKTSNPG
jgi:uncharacterized membrane protein